jgi:hypothetical protein
MTIQLYCGFGRGRERATEKTRLRRRPDRQVLDCVWGWQAVLGTIHAPGFTLRIVIFVDPQRAFKHAGSFLHRLVLRIFAFVVGSARRAEKYFSPFVGVLG